MTTKHITYKGVTLRVEGVTFEQFDGRDEFIFQGGIYAGEVDIYDLLTFEQVAEIRKLTNLNSKP